MTKMDTPKGAQREKGQVLRLLGVLLCILFSKTAAADIIVLDDFSTLASETITVTPGTGTSNSHGGQVVIAPGETVDWQDSLTALPFSTRKVTAARQNQGSASTVSIGYNSFDVSHPVGGNLTLNLSYEGGLANFSSADTLNINVTAKDTAGDGNLKPTLKLFSGSASAEASFATPLVVGINSISIRNLLQALNAAQISKVQINLVVPSDVDFTLSSIYFAPVPEPGMVSIGLACLIGYALIRSKKLRMYRLAHPASESHDLN
ncbi:MAG: hypothetical protein ACKO3T_01835 [Planctomycetaceae bacterium]